MENNGRRTRQAQTDETSSQTQTRTYALDFRYLNEADDAATPDIDASHPDAPEQARARIPPRKTAHKPHELEYMRQQGVFSTLPDDVCDDLVWCYFRHVHFFLPIVDAATFLNEYAQNGPRGVNLLLLWSMFLASANVRTTCS